MKKAKKNTTLAMYFIRIILLVALQVTAQVAFGSSNFTVVDSGYDHSIGLKSDGTLWAWGSEQFGQLGNNTITNTNTSTPIQIGADTNWTAISAGKFHSIALKSDGTLWAWGYNNFGQLGIGDGTNTDPNTNKGTPVQIGSETNWTAISAGGDHTVALKSGGTLWAWGNDFSGQLGNGNATDSNVPVQVGGDTNWTAISAGGDHTMAQKSGGTLWAWGYNANGQLGDGSTVKRVTPVQEVSGDTNWTGFSVGDLHSAALKTDGSLWTWGITVRVNLATTPLLMTLGIHRFRLAETPTGRPLWLAAITRSG